MDNRAQTVEIDHDKLCRYIRDTLHMTLIDFSYSIGKSKSYISGLARNPRVPAPSYNLICERCRVPFSFFEVVPRKEEQESPILRRCPEKKCAGPRSRHPSTRNCSLC